ncbi:MULTISPECIES: helix-turn-helix transcriptional regulator [Neisseria]|uniref:helix-turn-helix domain-containing protein n=1 Tax=Neisseria TaxID=482 RepID=UPI001661785D|nr:MULTISPECIES: helix-turn-helix transcriptional regulator [Neisseria]
MPSEGFQTAFLYRFRRRLPVTVCLICRVRTAAEWCIYWGMTQSKAAQKAGISQAALSQTEKQGSRPQT